MQRIEEYLEEEEVPDWASSLKMTISSRTPSDEICFRSSSFTWATSSGSASPLTGFQLGPLDINFPKGKLTLVSGATGSGKSALLLALLGGKSFN
jgi:ABC-type siderophore export system fused ATPase/permease subunit